MKNVEAAYGALVIAINPAILALGAAIFLSEKLANKQIVGVILALLGVIGIVISNVQSNWLVALGIGELALLGCIATWTVFTLVAKKILMQLKTLQVVFLSTAIGAIILFIMAVTLESSFSKLSILPLSVWLWFFVISILSTAMANFWYYQGIAVIGVAQTANFINLVPVFAAIFGVLFLKEIPTLWLLTGGSLVIIGIYLTNKHRKKT